MFNAEAANRIALQVVCEPIEEQIRIAVNEGKFLIYVLEIHNEAVKRFRDLGYNVDWDGSKSAFISWYSK